MTREEAEQHARAMGHDMGDWVEYASGYQGTACRHCGLGLLDMRYGIGGGAFMMRCEAAQRALGQGLVRVRARS